MLKMILFSRTSSLVEMSTTKTGTSSEPAQYTLKQADNILNIEKAVVHLGSVKGHFPCILRKVVAFKHF